MSIDITLKSQRVCIITGSSDGIGKTVAGIMAKSNYYVILANRNLNKAQLVVDEINKYSNSVLSLELDLSSFQSIKDFVNQFKSLNVKLDCLINNAGIYGPPFQLTKDGFESQFGVNHLGVFLLTNLLLDSMDEYGRIINLSSLAHKNANLDFDNLNETNKDTYKPLERYSNSKLCTILFTYELNRILKSKLNSKIVTVALHPGVIPDTNLFRNLSSSVQWVLNLAKPFVTSINTASLAVSRLAIGSDPDLEFIDGGQYFNIMKLQSSSNISNDPNAWRQLWSLSCQYCKIDDIGNE